MYVFSLPTLDSVEANENLIQGDTSNCRMEIDTDVRKHAIRA